METIKLKRPVAIKAIVTEKFKTEATKEIQQALQNFDLALQQSEFQGKRALADIDKDPQIQQKDEAKRQMVPRWINSAIRLMRKKQSCCSA